MADLIAQGNEPHHRWRRTLPEGKYCVVGRDSGAWATPWDGQISRRHVRIRWRNDRLLVERMDDALNPVFHGGEKLVRFSIEAGEHFVIGATTFTLTTEAVDLTVEAPPPLAEQTFSQQYLKEIHFRHADQQIHVLSQLPDVIAGAASETELYVQLVNLLLIGVPRADAAAIVMVADAARGAGDSPTVAVLHWDRRLVTRANFQPSGRLIRRAVETGESVMHVWSQSRGQSEDFTVTDGADWAFATPVRGEACRGWAVYLSGSLRIGSDASLNTGPEDFRDDLKFTELAATMLGNLQDMRRLERSHASLGQFFSPVVMEAFTDKSADEVLAPREAEVAVLFCDLRGFSRQAERMADDLFALLNRVSGALGVTTRHILEQGGVVGDFHGDAAMGFWGWPLAQEDAALRACRAALGIRKQLSQAAQEENHPLANFRMGIGIATGRAVAGRIGTVDQVKVTVFGPVVNLASRLEGMTDIIRAPILLDETTAQHVRQSASPEEARVRRVAVVKPFGMDTTVEVSELLPPECEFPGMRHADVVAYESALTQLTSGDWEEAFRLLHNVPAEDRVKDFLTVFIASHNRTPPADWDGVIPMKQKKT